MADYEKEEDSDDKPFDPTEWQTACWIVIDSYFNEKGLVRQQLDSFNEFIEITVQDIVTHAPPLILQPISQYHATEDVQRVCPLFRRHGE